MRTIFITGASAGLGKAIAKLFHDKGWSVIATMRNPERETELNQLERVTLLPLDLTQPAQIRAAVERATAISTVDVVVNNAGVGWIGALEDVTDAQLNQQIDTNLLGAIRRWSSGSRLIDGICREGRKAESKAYFLSLSGKKDDAAFYYPSFRIAKQV